MIAEGLMMQQARRRSDARELEIVAAQAAQWLAETVVENQERWRRWMWAR